LIKITAREAMILVHELTARTLGGLIGRSETIMQIIPRAEPLQQQIARTFRECRWRTALQPSGRERQGIDQNTD
jgi:hypothetical protein